jgi:dihydrofolate reductase
VVCESFLEAVQMAKEQAEDDGVDEVCVIGGRTPVRGGPAQGQAALPHRGAGRVDGDVTFPAFDEAAWTEVRREEHPAGRTTTMPSSSVCWSADKPVTPWP